MMLPTSPLCCTPAAYRLLARNLPVLASSDGLLSGALAIAMHQMRDVKPAAVDRQLQGYADRVRSRVRGDQPQALFAHLHEVLFEEEKFAGNADDYYAAENSYLPAVLRHRRGLPISLALVYKLVADRLGLNTWGVGLPGHFLVGIDDGGDDQRSTLVDPFHGGRVLSADEARAHVAEQFGGNVEWSDELLKPVGHPPLADPHVAEPAQPVRGAGPLRRCRRNAGDGDAALARAAAAAARPGAGAGPLRSFPPGRRVARPILAGPPGRPAVGGVAAPP